MQKRIRVLLNASVILSGLHSPTGGSSKVLKWSKEKKIKGIISETIYNEVLKHADKLRLDRKEIHNKLLSFARIYPAPKKQTVEKFKSVIMDYGDAHVLASYEELHCSALVSLDKKHILILKGKVKDINIFSPGEFIAFQNETGME